MRLSTPSLLLFALALFWPHPVLSNPVPGTKSTVRIGEENKQELRFESEGVELQATLWLPSGEGPHPALVFLAGSGRSIRDLDTDPDPLPAHLVKQGIALLAYDKRGVRDSGGVFRPLPTEDRALQEEVLDTLARDGAAALRAVRQHPRVDAERVGFWAFSQGGWVASRLAAVGADPATLIVVGGPATSIAEELVYSELARAARTRSREEGVPLRMADLEEEHRRVWHAREPDGSYHPEHGLRAAKTPTLWLLGEWDLSVPAASSLEVLGDIATDRANFDVVIVERANHGLAVLDPAGRWYIPESVWELVFEALGNQGFAHLDRDFEWRIQIRTESSR